MLYTLQTARCSALLYHGSATACLPRTLGGDPLITFTATVLARWFCRRPLPTEHPPAACRITAFMLITAWFALWQRAATRLAAARERAYLRSGTFNNCTLQTPVVAQHFVILPQLLTGSLLQDKRLIGSPRFIAGRFLQRLALPNALLPYLGLVFAPPGWNLRGSVYIQPCPFQRVMPQTWLTFYATSYQCLTFRWRFVITPLLHPCWQQRTTYGMTRSPYLLTIFNYALPSRWRV